MEKSHLTLRLSSILVIFALLGCSKSLEKEFSETTFLFKPESSRYHNGLDFKGIDLVMPIELDRAREISNIDFRMLLLKDLPTGFTPEQYAVKAMTSNKIGEKNQGRGVLILFAEKQGVLKIEVSYELEGLFPDGYVGSLQEQAKNYFAGDFFGDFLTSVVFSMTHRQKGDPYEKATALNGGEANHGNKSWLGGRFLSGGAGVTEMGFFKTRLKKNRNVIYLSQKQRAKYNKDKNVKLVINRFIDSLRKGINDPFLPLLTEGSQYMRLEYPKSAAFLRSMHSDFNSGFKVLVKDDLAAARFNNKEALPIYLRRDNEGDWLVDVTKSWALSQKDFKQKKMRPADMDHPWMFAYPEYQRLPVVPRTPQLIPFPYNIKKIMGDLEAAIQSDPSNAANYFKLADVFYYECYWIADAIKMAEKGLLLDPVAGGYTPHLAKMKYRYPDLSRLDKIYATTLKADPGNKSLAGFYIGYLKQHKSGEPNTENLVKQIKALEKKMILPKAPYVATPSAAHYRRRTFYFPIGTQQISTEMTMHSANWDDDFKPYTCVTLKGIKNKNFVGIGISQKARGTRPTIYLTLYGKVVESTRQDFSFERVAHVNFSWDDQNILDVSVNGVSLVSDLQLSFIPRKIRSFTRSANARYHIKIKKNNKR